MEPPEWSRKNISLSESTSTNLREIYNEAFFADRGESRTEAVDKIDEFGYNVVGQGTGRIAISGGDIPDGVVAKVGIKQRGYQDNQEEHYMRDEIHPKVRPFTTPVLDAGSSCSWIAVEKCEEGDADAVRTLSNVLDDNNVQYTRRELAKGNVGYYENQPCIIDWASLF